MCNKEIKNQYFMITTKGKRSIQIFTQKTYARARDLCGFAVTRCKQICFEKKKQKNKKLESKWRQISRFAGIACKAQIVTKDIRKFHRCLRLPRKPFIFPQQQHFEACNIYLC